MKAVALKAGKMTTACIFRLSRFAGRGGEGVGEWGAVWVARECGQHEADVAGNPVHEGRVSSWESITIAHCHRLDVHPKLP